MEIQIDRPSGDKREQILEAAIQIFAHQGFHDAKVEEIAAAAGVGKGTVYEYFRSKEELFYEMLDFVRALYVDQFQKEVLTATGVNETLKRMFLNHLKFIYRHRDMARVLLVNHPVMDDKLYRWVLSRRQEMLTFCEELVRRGIASGEVREVNPAVAGLMIAGIFNSLGNQVALGETPADLPRFVSQALDVLMKGLAPKD
ncbi:hypothetical protein SY88_17470 [Clostridiales bacterium PH28_bin88]|nr:hypothetical protein SY88_17470 [Clostridiales bacterium PH28_bin88]